MNKTIKPARVGAMVGIFILIMGIYLYFLYDLQIVQGDEYYHQSELISHTKRVVTAARGNILDRYGRVLVSNKECYDLRIDNSTISPGETARIMMSCSQGM